MSTAVTTVPATEEAVGALVRACSPHSLRQRFFLNRDLDPGEALVRYRHFLLDVAPPGHSVVAVAAGVPAGLLNLHVARDGVVEVGLLVADAWLRRGIGTHLVTTELAHRRWAGRTVRAVVEPDNLAARALLRRQRLGPCRLVSQDHDQLDYEIILDAPSA
jgi:ribosomal protein S18 acetylase RimI-like enzyme